MSKMKGVITKSTGLWYDVRTETGEVIPCRLRGKFRIDGNKNTNPAVVGDHVVFDLEKDNTGYIIQIEKRKNYIDRKSTKLSKINHLIAANIDQAFLVVTLKEPRTSLGFIDRFLVACEGFRIPVCMVFNKTDIYVAKELHVIEELSKLYQSIGCLLWAVRYSFVFEKCLFPKNPFDADNGDGCADSKTKLFSLSISAPFCLA